MQRLFVGIAAASLLLAATACGSSGDSGGSASESGGTTKVKVGVIPIVDVAPVYLGQKQGIYKKYGLDVSMTTAQGGSAIVPGVVSGQFQFGFSNSTSLMVAQSNGIEVKAVSNGVATTGVDGKDYGALVVKKGSSLKSAKDLEGKTVAVNTQIPSSVLAKVTLPKWPADISRSSVETLEKLGEQDGLFKTAPDLDELLP